MLDTDVEFGHGEDAVKAENEWREKCRDVQFVIDGLKKFQRYRKGVGEYQCDINEIKVFPPPFCGLALSIIEDSAVEMLERYRDGRTYDEGA